MQSIVRRSLSGAACFGVISALLGGSPVGAAGGPAPTAAMPGMPAMRMSAAAMPATIMITNRNWERLARADFGRWLMAAAFIIRSWHASRRTPASRHADF